MAYKGRFFALYADGTSALAASERELSELRGDRVETVSGHAEALDADAELMALFLLSRETPEDKTARLATATVDELVLELAQRRDPVVLEALALKATAEAAKVPEQVDTREKLTELVRAADDATLAELRVQIDERIAERGRK